MNPFRTMMDTATSTSAPKADAQSFSVDPARFLLVVDAVFAASILSVRSIIWALAVRLYRLFPEKRIDIQRIGAAA